MIGVMFPVTALEFEQINAIVNNQEHMREVNGPPGVR